MTDKQFLEQEIAAWLRSPERKWMLTGERYYRGEQDILHRKRTAIGEGGRLVVVDNLPNNRLVDNRYAQLVDQKSNYLIGKPLTFDMDDDAYQRALGQILGRDFQRTLKAIAVDCYNAGIGWLHPYYDDAGALRFRRFPPYEIMPMWADAEHTRLDLAVRVYPVEAYEGQIKTVRWRAEVYGVDGVRRYDWSGVSLTEDRDAPYAPYIEAAGRGYNWQRVPLIAFRANDRELPLIARVKTLQDAVNELISDWANCMQEDSRNTVLVLRDYDGQDLGEFRRNLAAYSAVKVQEPGGIDTLQITVDADNYQKLLPALKKSLIENGRGYDAKDERLAGNPNQMTIQSMYSDIDLDANGMETEWQAAFEQLLWFVSAHLANTGQGSFEGVDLTVIFNRDMLINETEAINNCKASVGILSDETIVGQHPWTTDVKRELDRLQEEKQQAIDEYAGAFKAGGIKGDGDAGP